MITDYDLIFCNFISMIDLKIEWNRYCLLINDCLYYSFRSWILFQGDTKAISLSVKQNNEKIKKTNMIMEIDI